MEKDKKVYLRERDVELLESMVLLVMRMLNCCINRSTITRIGWQVWLKER